MGYTDYLLHDDLGKVHKAGSCAMAYVQSQSIDGLTLLLKTYKPGAYIDSGEVVMPPTQPSRNHTFNYTTKQWEDPRTPQQAEDQQWEAVRAQRNSLLSASDWVVTRATEAGEAVPIEWVSYRQALRDVTLQPDPWNIDWPNKGA